MSIGSAISAAVGIGGSLLSGREQAGGAESAAGLYGAASQMAVEEQRRQFDLTRKDLAPYRETGETALGEYGSLYGVGREGLLSTEEMQSARDRFKETPGYDFRFNEGVRALDRSAASRGGLQGGGYGRELTRYGQGIASDEFGNYANRLAGIAGIGQSATNTGAAIGAQTSANIGNTYMAGAAGQGNALQNAATARASGYAGAANAVTGGVQNYMLQQALGRPGGGISYDPYDY